MIYDLELDAYVGYIGILWYVVVFLMTNGAEVNFKATRAGALATFNLLEQFIKFTLKRSSAG